MKIGVLSDTHNLLRREVLDSLRGCDAILHAGDVSRQDLLDSLAELAPVYAVRGNNEENGENLPVQEDIELGGIRICMAHKRKDLPQDLSAYDLAVFGHSHRYSETWLSSGAGKRTLVLNPGSCGPRRFYQAITMALVTVDADGLTVQQVEIAPSGKGRARPSDLHEQIERVICETEKKRGPKEIAQRLGMEEELAEQIVRLYLTHPGVSADGIMTKMGL